MIGLAAGEEEEVGGLVSVSIDAISLPFGNERDGIFEVERDGMAISLRLEELTSLAARQTPKQASVALMSRKQ